MSADIGQVPEPTLVRFSRLGELGHGIGSRHGGVSPDPYSSLNLSISTGDEPENVSENRRLFLAALGLSTEEVLYGRLTHGNRVAVFQRHEDLSGDQIVEGDPAAPGGRRFVADAIVTSLPGRHFAMTFADCVPLVYWDRKQRVAGAAHAGWRGTARGISPAVIRTMQTVFGTEPHDIEVGIGPSIGPCCYTVASGVLQAFREAGRTPELIEDKSGISLDLWTTNQKQLVEAGVRPDAIERLDICTSCNVDTFFSHRREAGMTGRFGLCIGLP